MKQYGIVLSLICAVRLCAGELQDTKVQVSDCSPVRCISMAEVQRQARVVQKDLTNRRRIKTALIVTGSGLLCWQLYRCVRDLVGKDKGHICINTDAKQSWGDWITAGKTWTKAGKFGLEVVSSVVTSVIVNGLISRYIVPDSLMWYVDSCAPYRATLLEIEAHLASAQDDTGYHIRAVYSAYSVLIVRLMKVLGYMHAKVSDLRRSCQAEAREVIVHALETINECSTALDRLWCQGTITEQALSEHIAQLHTTLGADLMRFARLEGSIWIDLAQLKRMAEILGDFKKSEAKEAVQKESESVQSPQVEPKSA